MPYKKVIPLSKEERMLIEEGIKKDLSLYKISYSIGRRPSCIHREVKRNGEREDYNAETAQALADFTRQNYMSNLRKPRPDYKRGPKTDSSAVTNYTEFTNRIEALEAQIETIFEILKERK